MNNIIYNDVNKAVSLGLIPGASTVNKWGHNESVNVADGEALISEWGGAFDPITDIITVAQTFTVTYNNITDGLGTTGTLTLLVIYLDENTTEQEITHTLGNTGSDVTSFTGLGINRVLVSSNGGLGYNVNDITITATTDTTTQAIIPALASVTHQCIFHTAIGYCFLVDYIWANVIKLAGGTAPKVKIKIYSWSRVTLTRYDIFEGKIDTGVVNELTPVFEHPFPIGGREVIYMVATTDKDNTEVEARFSGGNFKL